MAGSFGCGHGHYAVGQACGERVLFLTVHGSVADHLIVAFAFGCRHDISDLCTNRRSLAHREVACGGRI
jgi:hypothetical protein